MKIGYLILCHKEPSLIKRIAEKVTSGTENEAFIHVDQKSNIADFMAMLPETNQIHYVKERVQIWWGGFNSIVATINCMKQAVIADCDRLVILQGQDYPARSNSYIDEFFRKNSDVEFIKAFNVTKSPNKWNYMKCWGIHIFDRVERRKLTFRNVLSKAIEVFNRLGIKYHRGYYKDKKRKMDVYWGWAHFAVTKECAQYLIEFYEMNTKFNEYFKTVFPPDETYFHTIIFNSDFKYKTSMKDEMPEPDEFIGEPFCNVTYFDYLPGKVKVIKKIEELEEIRNKGFLYFRKVDNTCESLMDYIDQLKE